MRSHAGKETPPSAFHLPRVVDTFPQDCLSRLDGVWRLRDRLLEKLNLRINDLYLFVGVLEWANFIVIFLSKL